MPFNDLKFFQEPRHSRAAKHGRCCHVFRQAHILTGDGAPSAPRLSPMRREIQRQLQGQGLHVSRPLPLHGVCSAYLPGEPAGYRGLSESPKEQAVPHGNPQCGIPEHHRQCEQDQGLAHLRRLSPLPDPNCSETVCGRQFRSRSREHRLCLGCHDDRFVPFDVSLGRIQNHQRGGETPYAARPARQHPNLHLHLRWQTPRGEYSRPRSSGTWRFLRNGSGISRLPAALPLSPLSGLLRNPCKVEPEIPARLFRANGSINGNHVRSDDFAHRSPVGKALSGKASPGEILRCRQRQNSSVSEQQLRFATPDNRTTLQEQVADRAVFQMDQAEPADQDFLWYLRECRQGSDLDRGLGVSARRDHEEATENQGQSLHNSTGPECDCF